MQSQKTVDVAQLVRASVCGAEGRGFEPHLPPFNLRVALQRLLFLFYNTLYQSWIMTDQGSGQKKDLSTKKIISKGCNFQSALPIPKPVLNYS